jgi:large subunit ribosomal protein L22
MEQQKPESMAKLRYVRMSPQKVRLVVDLVRGLPVEQALAVLRFSTKRAAEPVAKTIKSAAANAEENLGLAREDLVVKSIFADEGPTMKRARFGARGRYKPVLKRSSHITVVVTER